MPRRRPHPSGLKEMHTNDFAKKRKTTNRFGSYEYVYMRVCVCMFLSQKKQPLYIAVILCAFPLADKTINHFNNLLEANAQSASRKS